MVEPSACCGWIHKVTPLLTVASAPALKVKSRSLDMDRRFVSAVISLVVRLIVPVPLIAEYVVVSVVLTTVAYDVIASACAGVSTNVWVLRFK